MNYWLRTTYGAGEQNLRPRRMRLAQNSNNPLERDTRIELALIAWEATVLPLY